MAAIPIGQPGYIMRNVAWGKSQFKMGRLANRPGTIPKALRPFLLQKGEVSPIVSECRAKGLSGASLVQCINTGVALKKGRG